MGVANGGDVVLFCFLCSHMFLYRLIFPVLIVFLFSLLLLAYCSVLRSSHIQHYIKSTWLHQYLSWLININILFWHCTHKVTLTLFF